MIKILFFIPGLSAGGAEKVLRNLVNNMDQSKFDITVQTIEDEDADKYLVKGIHYKSINRCKTKLGKKLFQYWFRFCAEFKLAYPFYIKDDYDIEVAYLECGATKIISSSTNKKAVKLAWVHCDLAKKEGIAENVAKMKKQYEKFDKVVCVSKDAETSFKAMFGKEIETVVLSNVIDEDEILKKAQEPLKIKMDESRANFLAVGRLTWQKGFDRLVETCAKLRDDGYKFHLYILGEGPERENLEGLIKKYHLEEIVELVGFVTNPYSYMKAADYVVCSSRYEGISTAATEALILGKTFITTPCTGMEELLGQSEYGMIAVDTEDGFYFAMKKNLDMKKLKESYSKKAGERGNDFKKVKLVNRTEKFFAKEIAKKGD